MIISRSTVFLSSRTLPRQGWRRRASSAGGVKALARKLFSALNCRTKCSTSGVMSSVRSRSGGTRMGITDRRK